MVTGDPDLYRHSSLREGLLEHVLVGDIMRALWRRGPRDFDVLRPVTDAAGYDVVLSANGVVRQVQLKSSALGASTSRQKINTALARQTSGCVIWMRFDPATMDLGPFSWFGAAPGMPLPDLGERVGRHTRGNAQGEKALRQGIRVLVKSDFEHGLSLDRIVERLFG